MKLGKQATGLEAPPYPGEFGQRAYQNISAEAWKNWLERLVVVVNEEQLNTSESCAFNVVEQYNMVGYLFDESEFGGMPEGVVSH